MTIRSINIFAVYKTLQILDCIITRLIAYYNEQDADLSIGDLHISIMERDFVVGDETLNFSYLNLLT